MSFRFFEVGRELDTQAMPIAGKITGAKLSADVSGRKHVNFNVNASVNVTNPEGGKQPFRLDFRAHLRCRHCRQRTQQILPLCFQPARRLELSVYMV